jgi:multimeric flavodoxin WrbA
MKKILMIYYSHTGHTEKMVLAAAEGAREAGAEVIVKKSPDAVREDLVNCDAVIWGTGNYFQNAAGMLRDYFDRYHYDFLKMKKELGVKPYACVCSAAAGGAGCLGTINTLMKQLKFKRAFEPVTAFEDPTDDVLAQSRELGKKMAELKPEDAVDLNPPTAVRWQWPDKFRMIAWKGVGVEISKSWAEVMAEDVGTKLVVAPEVNTVNRFKWTGQRLFDITAGGTTETSQMVMADRKYAARDTGPFPIRAVWAQSRSHSGYFVRADSPIKDIYDIKAGTKIAGMLTYLASIRIVEAFLAWIKVDPKDIDWVEGGSYKENVDSVIDGRCDVCFGIPTSPSVIAVENHPIGIRWLDMNSDKDPEGAARFREVDPLIDFGPMFNGVPSSIGVWATTGTSLYTTHRDTHKILIYRTAKWLHENYERIKERHSWCEWMNIDVLLEELERTFIPVHDGLKLLLQETGHWTNAMEVRSEANAALIDRYVVAFQECKDMADAKEMIMSPDNAEWIDMWENYRRQQGIPEIQMYMNQAEGK